MAERISSNDHYGHLSSSWRTFTYLWLKNSWTIEFLEIEYTILLWKIFEVESLFTFSKYQKFYSFIVFPPNFVSLWAMAPNLLNSSAGQNSIPLQIHMRIMRFNETYESSYHHSGTTDLFCRCHGPFMTNTVATTLILGTYLCIVILVISSILTM